MEQIYLRNDDIFPFGKRVTILTGVHGNETTPLWCGITLQDLIHKNMPQDWSSIKILQGCNMSGLRAQTRETVSPKMNDLNRGWATEKDPREEIKKAMYVK